MVTIHIDMKKKTFATIVKPAWVHTTKPVHAV